MDCWNSSSVLKKHVFDSLRKLNISPSKQRGQNFLVDHNIIRFQVKQAQIGKNDCILEIGGGIGNLSKCLAEVAKKVFIIEADRRLVGFLQDFLSCYPNVEILHGDAVKIEFPKFNKCISNLPYQISSPITFKLLDHKFDLAVLMYQKEFAQRFFASPGSRDYSRISVMMNLRANCSYLKTVKPSSFFPAPKVLSSIVSITKKENINRLDYQDFGHFIILLFTQKKKTVRNVLVNLIKRKTKQNFEINQDVLKNLPYLENRIFNLSIDELIEIYSILKSNLGEELWLNMISPNIK
jgi:16S rRNA (adenine1518-N6/adenine1519-N6)-dimethyltransferase